MVREVVPDWRAFVWKRANPVWKNGSIGVRSGQLTGIRSVVQVEKVFVLVGIRVHVGVGVAVELFLANR
jgi:hypothetical protein